MSWTAVAIDRVAPAKASRRSFFASDSVWHLTLDQIESNSNEIAAKHYGPASAAGTSTYVFDEGNVLYSKLRPYLNKVVAPDESGIATTELVPLRPDLRILDRRFLAYYLRSPTFVGEASRRVAGAKMPRVKMDWLRAHEMPLPSPSEQHRIVEILDQADALRKLRRDADAKAARILPALFLKMFGDPATNPMGWPVKALGAPDVCEINPRAEHGLDGDLEVSFVPMADIDERLGRIVGAQTRPVSRVRKGFTAFRDNDVLFAKITPCMQNGKAAIATDLVNGLGYGSTEFHVLRAQQGIAPEWVFTLVRLQTFRDQARAAFTGSAGQQRVPSTFFKSFQVPIPSPQAMSKFADAAQETFRILEACESLTAKVDKIFALLLQRAFSGQLTAKWRKAHMQELLIEMQEQARLLNLPAPN